MRITLMTIGTTGDVLPYVLLGKELRSRGHRITIAAFSDFEAMVKDAGLLFFPLAGDVKDFISRLMGPGVIGPAVLIQLEKALKDVAPVLLDDIMQAGEGADAIVCTFFGSTYYSVAEKYRIPCIQTQYFPMDSNSLGPMSSAPGLSLGKGWYHATYRIGYLLISILEKRYLTEWRIRNGISTRGLRTTPDYQLSGHTIPVIYAVSPQVLPRDPSWSDHIHISGYWWNEAEPDAALPEDLAEFISSGPAPVYIGFGSMVSGDMRRTFTCVLRAVHASGVRAVISLGWSNANLPRHNSSRIFFADYVPHQVLFPHMAAVVHHGGCNTVAAGLRAGKPTLVIPFGGDQPFWGKRVHAIGCGPRPIPRDSMTVARLAKALTDLTTRPSYRLNAEAVAARLAQEHGLTNAADMILKEIEAWQKST